MPESVLAWMASRAGMVVANDVTGAVLCGGLSRRMGTNKALLEIHPGMRQLDYAIALLRSVCGEVVACIGPEGRNDLVLPAGVTAIRDIDAVDGPMAGIMAALIAVRGRGVLALAGDMPYVDEPLLEELIGGRDTGKLATALIAGDGKPEPMCTVYEAASLERLNELASAHRHSLRDFLSDSAVALVQASQPWRLASVNDRIELEAARRQLRGPGNANEGKP